MGILESIHRPRRTAAERMFHMAHTPPEFWDRDICYYAGWDRAKRYRAEKKLRMKYNDRVPRDLMHEFRTRHPTGPYWPCTKSLPMEEFYSFHNDVQRLRDDYRFFGPQRYAEDWEIPPFSSDDEDFAWGAWAGAGLPMWEADERWRELDTVYGRWESSNHNDPRSWFYRGWVPGEGWTREMCSPGTRMVPDGGGWRVEEVEDGEVPPWLGRGGRVTRGAGPRF